MGERGTVVLFDERTGEVKRLEGHSDHSTVKGVAFHPAGKWLATAGKDSRIILWSMPDGEKLREWEAPAQVWALALSPDGKTLAGGGTDHDVTLWNAETGEKLKTLPDIKAIC